MSPESVIEIGQQALGVALLVAAPILITALVMGLFIGMIQAATQIQEMSLSFVPKLIAMGFTLALAGGWMLNLLVDFTQRLISDIPAMIG